MNKECVHPRLWSGYVVMVGYWTSKVRDKVEMLASQVSLVPRLHSPHVYRPTRSLLKSKLQPWLKISISSQLQWISSCWFRRRYQGVQFSCNRVQSINPCKTQWWAGQDWHSVLINIYPCFNNGWRWNSFTTICLSARRFYCNISGSAVCSYGIDTWSIFDYKQQEILSGENQECRGCSQHSIWKQGKGVHFIYCS